MKKKVIKLDKALSLDKETMARLNEEQLSALEGGVTQTETCNTKLADDTTFTTTSYNSCHACSCYQ